MKIAHCDIDCFSWFFAF